MMSKGEIVLVVLGVLSAVSVVYVLWAVFYLVVYRKRKFDLPNATKFPESKREFNLNQQYYNLYFHFFSGNSERASRFIDVVDAKKYQKSNWKKFKAENEV